MNRPGAQDLQDPGAGDRAAPENAVAAAEAPETDTPTPEDAAAPTTTPAQAAGDEPKPDPSARPNGGDFDLSRNTGSGSRIGADAPPAAGPSEPGPGRQAAVAEVVAGERRSARVDADETPVREAARPGPAVESTPGETFHAMVFDLGQSATRQADASAAPAPTGATPDPRSPSPAVPVSAVPIEIGMRALSGAQSFQIRLHPEEFGRVDVRLDIDDDGSVSAQITVDRVEALNMLQRDAKTLERAFEQAGLKTTENGLQFTLNTGGDGRGASADQNGRDQRQGRPAPQGDPDTPLLPAEAAAALRSIRTGARGLDIRI